MMVSFEDFKKVEIRIGKIVGAERLENSEKLLKLEVDFGVEIGKRQILAGIAKFYTPEALVGKLCPFVVNLETKIIAGLESQGMILCTGNEGPVLLRPEKEVAPGSIIK